MSYRVKKTTTIHEAKTHLSRLIERALRGEDIVIHKGPVAVVRLVPIKHAVPERKFGAMKGRLRVPASFFEPLPDEELEAWEK